MKIINLIKLFLTCIFISSCGFTPVLKDFDNTNINVAKISISETNNNLAFLLKNYLNIKENNENGINILINITENIEPVERNSAGIIIKEKLSISIYAIYTDSNNTLLNKDTFNENQEINIISNPEIDKDTKDNERRNILKNLSRKIRFKTLIISKNFQ